MMTIVFLLAWNNISAEASLCEKDFSKNKSKLINLFAVFIFDLITFTIGFQIALHST
jgi:hypothetical protein